MEVEDTWSNDNNNWQINWKRRGDNYRVPLDRVGAMEVDKWQLKWKRRGEEDNHRFTLDNQRRCQPPLTCNKLTADA